MFIKLKIKLQMSYYGRLLKREIIIKIPSRISNNQKSTFLHIAH